MTLLINILVGLFVVVALLMILVILMQRPKSEGLGAAFGGGVTENIFGAQTTNVLTKFTGWLAAIFFLLTFVLSILYARKANMQSDLRKQIIESQTPAPIASATPATPATSPAASPGPSSAVGPPNTVTNLTPGTTNSPAASVESGANYGLQSPAPRPPANSPAVAPKPSVAPPFPLRRRGRKRVSSRAAQTTRDLAVAICAAAKHQAYPDGIRPSTRGSD